MAILEKLDMWCFLALLIIILSFWLLAGGIRMLKAAHSGHVDEKKLRIRAWGGLVLGLAYLVSHFRS